MELAEARQRKQLPRLRQGGKVQVTGGYGEYDAHSAVQDILVSASTTMQRYYSCAQAFSSSR
jgi:S-adenosylmethionine synthetase